MAEGALAKAIAEKNEAYAAYEAARWALENPPAGADKGALRDAKEAAAERHQRALAAVVEAGFKKN